MRIILLIIAFFCFVIFQCGCETTGSNSPDINTALLEPSMAPKLLDIPVPAGLKPLTQESYYFENSGIRAGALKYRGKANPDQLVNFFKEQMAMNNWNLLNVIEYGNRLLNFERETETCIINIVPKGSSVIVTISLAPKSQTDMANKKKDTSSSKSLFK